MMLNYSSKATTCGSNSYNNLQILNKTRALLVTECPAYVHLPDRHEVCALSDSLEDLLQLGTDE